MQNTTSPLTQQNRLYTSPSEIGEILAQNYSNISSNSNYDPPFISQKLLAAKTLYFSIPSTTTSPLSYNVPISENEVIQTINQCSKASAPSFDQISSMMLQNLHANAISHFTDILNRLFSLGTYPTIWKLAIIIPLLKPLKDPSNPLSYRPISLLSSLSKILVKILNKRLSWYLESNNLISASQYGGRKNRSLITAFADLDSLIYEANNNESTLYSIFFDMESAFPRVWTHLICTSLHKLGLRGQLPPYSKLSP